MSLGFYCDKNILPSDEAVIELLGEAADYLIKLKELIQKYGATKEEWKIYNKQAGWCKKILLISGKEERNIIFLYPNQAYFTVVLVYGEKAVEALGNFNLPENVIKTIFSAKAYKEGRSFNFEVRSKEDFENIKKLVEIKIQH